MLKPASSPSKVTALNHFQPTPSRQSLSSRHPLRSALPAENSSMKSMSRSGSSTQDTTPSPLVMPPPPRPSPPPRPAQSPKPSISREVSSNPLKPSPSLSLEALCAPCALAPLENPLPFQSILPRDPYQFTPSQRPQRTQLLLSQLHWLPSTAVLAM
jgi:hypothetical protein